MSVPQCKLPDGSGYFLYFKLNDHADLVEEGARLIAERIKVLGIENPYFVTPEASTLALAHVLRHKYGIQGTTIYKTIQLNDIDPISISYDTVTSVTKKTLYLGQNKVAEMRDKNIFILDSICTTGGSIKGTYQLLVKAGISPNQIVEATMLFNEGEDKAEIHIEEGVTVKLYHFGYLPLITSNLEHSQNSPNSFAII